MSALFDPAAIERRIDESLALSGRAVKRSSLLTLVVVHPREAQAAVAARLDRLFGRRPMRVIRVETGHPGPTDVTVGARCLAHHAGDEVCFQEIVFANGPDNRGLTSAVWSPLVIRDLPAVLLWLQAAGGLVEFLSQPSAVFDLCLVDSPGVIAGRAPERDFARELAILARRFSDLKRPPALADLGWRSLLPWRARIARLFDRPACLPLLGRLERIELAGPVSDGPLLLGLWLAARLGWKNGKLSGDGLDFRDAAGKQVTVELSDGPRGRFRAEFHAASGETLGVKGEAGQGVRLSGPGGEESGVWADADCADCLLAEIDRLSPDAVYYEVLALAAALRWFDKLRTG